MWPGESISFPALDIPRRQQKTSHRSQSSLFVHRCRGASWSGSILLAASRVTTPFWNPNLWKRDQRGMWNPRLTSPEAETIIKKEPKLVHWLKLCAGSGKCMRTTRVTFGYDVIIFFVASMSGLPSRILIPKTTCLGTLNLLLDFLSLGFCLSCLESVFSTRFFQCFCTDLNVDLGLQLEAVQSRYRGCSSTGRVCRCRHWCRWTRPNPWECCDKGNKKRDWDWQTRWCSCRRSKDWEKNCSE